MANIVFIACSLDGFIAKPDGDLDWLVNVPNETNDDYGFTVFEKKIDAILMGRMTFETILGFAAWPYAKPVFVLSNSLSVVPGKLKGKAEIVKGDIRAILGDLANRGFRNLYVDGGRTIQSFLKADLIDEMIITWVSKIIGRGIPLFGEIGVERVFEVRKAEVLNNFFVQCHYVKKGAVSVIA